MGATMEENPVLRAADKILKSIPLLEKMKDHVPKLFTAGMAVHNAFTLLKGVAANLNRVTEEAQRDLQEKEKAIQEELQKALRQSEDATSEARQEYLKKVNGAKSLYGTKLEALRAAVEGYEKIQRKLKKLESHNQVEEETP